MADAASGSADKSVQVKLVLLGTSLFLGLEPLALLSHWHVILTGVIVQAKLPLANLPSSSASYVVSHRTMDLYFPST